MNFRSLALCFALLILALPAWSTPVLQTIGSLENPPAVDWTAWGEQTFAVTDIDVRVVSWNEVEGARDHVAFTLPVPVAGIEEWGDQILLQLPGYPSRLIDRGAGNASRWTDVDENWHLPNVELEGEPYRVLIEPDFYLMVLTAPGYGSVQGLLPFEDTIGSATMWDIDGDRAVLANDDGLHVVNLSNPLVPIIQSTITPPVQGWLATDLDVHGDIVAVCWGNRFQLWDISNALAPVLLDEAGTDDSYLALGDRWLAAWEHYGRAVTVWNVQDPEAMSVRGAFDADAAVSGRGDIRVDGDNLMVNTNAGLARVGIPAWPAPIVFDGPGWPVIEARIAATDGRAVWLQGERDRIVVDAPAAGLVGVQPDIAAWGSNVLLPVGDVLYHNIEDEGLHIESLADPFAPQDIAVIDAEPLPTHADVSGNLLAIADAAGLTLYDVSDPAAPARRGDLALDGTPNHVLLVGDVAVVITDHEFDASQVHVIDVSDILQPQLLTSIVVDPGGSGDAWRAPQLIRRGSGALVMCLRDGPISTIVRTLTIDLTNPAAPQTAYTDAETDVWCFGPDAETGERVVQRELPVQIGDFHISFDTDTVTVYRALTGPTDLEPVTSWTTSGDAVENIAAAGNMLLVVSGYRLDVLTLSDPAVVDVPDAPATNTVRTVPNPFNPLTEIRFTMTGAGSATVEIIDPRGRRVRTLSAELPAGPASLRWDGTDQHGRAVPSGTYLLRVATPTAAAIGRCQLVR